ncbi:MAG: metal-sulfur cluster assembly factor [Lactobacillus sp.]|nr:metal-sulfur cluster assembly factor [Lactobacillus sp.]MCI2033037.1 metal-sulfur cluster assembly factor [Lactobacillus sp.]
MRDDIKVNDRAAALGDQIAEKLETIYDDELGVDIYNLGFIYEVYLDENKHCDLVLSFSEMGCSCLDEVPGQITAALTQLAEIDTVDVKVVWSPAWQMTRISRYGRMALGISVH